MLKTLEEPAAFAHLILLSSRPGKLLPTISSRCQLVRFDAPPPEAIAKRLVESDGLDPGAADAAARLGLGDAERARSATALRPHAEAYARAALSGDLAERPWVKLLAQARKAGDAAEAAGQERARGGGVQEEEQVVHRGEEQHGADDDGHPPVCVLELHPTRVGTGEERHDPHAHGDEVRVVDGARHEGDEAGDQGGDRQGVLQGMLLAGKIASWDRCR
jgi:hypothetical protein